MMYKYYSLSDMEKNTIGKTDYKISLKISRYSEVFKILISVIIVTHNVQNQHTRREDAASGHVGYIRGECTP